MQRIAMLRSIFVLGCLLHVLGCGPKAQPPSIPVLTGPSRGIAGDTQAFRVVSEDDFGDSVAFMIDWDDTSHNVWTSFVQSGEVKTITHVYAESSNRSIKARARNGAGGESDWSEGCSLQLVGPGPGYADSLLVMIEMDTGLSKCITHLALSGDDRFLYACCFMDTSLYVVRTADCVPFETLFFHSVPHGMSVSPDGSILYLALSQEDSIAVVRTSDNTVVAKLPAESPHDVAASPDGQMLYAVSYDDHMLRGWRTSSYLPTIEVSVGAMPLALAVGSDGGLVYVVSARESSLTIVNTATRSVSRSPNLGQGPWAVCAGLDAQKVYVGLYVGGVVVLSRAGDQVRATIPTDGIVSRLVPTPDGCYLLVGNDSRSGIPVVRTSVDVVVGTIAAVGAGASALAVSSDGSRIYSGDDWGRIFVHAR